MSAPPFVLEDAVLRSRDVSESTVDQRAGESANRRRVLHVINGQHYSGAERVQDLLGLGLPEFGYDVAYACVKPGQFPAQRQAQDLTLHEVPMTSKTDLAAGRRLAQVAQAGDFDLLHAHGIRSLLLTRIASHLVKLPFVYHVHSPALAESTKWMSNRINAWIERFCLRGASQIICVSHSLAEYLCWRDYPADLIHVVPNGVPKLSELEPRPTPRDPWTLGTIALFRPRKGIEILIEALSLLRMKGHDVHLRAVGSFETTRYESKIRRWVEDRQLQDIIEWKGFASDVEAELAQMDLLVLPSLFGEGLPMVILEAMAAGVPVVASEIPGIAEVLEAGAGLLAKPGSAEDLASKLESFLIGSENWHAVREQAWFRQSRRYSDRSMARGVAAVYDRALEQVLR